MIKSDYRESIKISNALDMFISGKKNQIKKSTLMSYSLAVNTMKKAIGDLELDKINKSHRNKIVNTMQRTLDTTTINIRLRGIRAFLNYMIQET